MIAHSIERAAYDAQRRRVERMLSSKLRAAYRQLSPDEQRAFIVAALRSKQAWRRGGAR